MSRTVLGSAEMKTDPGVPEQHTTFPHHTANQLIVFKLKSQKEVKALKSRANSRIEKAQMN